MESNNEAFAWVIVMIVVFIGMYFYDNNLKMSPEQKAAIARERMEIMRNARGIAVSDSAAMSNVFDMAGRGNGYVYDMTKIGTRDDGATFVFPVMSGKVGNNAVSVPNVSRGDSIKYLRTLHNANAAKISRHLMRQK